MLYVLPALFAFGQRDQATDLLRFFYSKAADRTIGSRIEVDYKTTPPRFLDIAEKVTRRMIAPDFDYVQGVTVEARAKTIQSAVIGVVREVEPSANDLLKERMVIQGLYDWTRTHLLYNDWLSDMSMNPSIRRRFVYAKDLFLMERPSCMCPGYADSFASMAQALGINATKVNGATRRHPGKIEVPVEAKDALGHKWVIVRMRDGFLQPVDPTNSVASLAKARELGGRIPEPITLPNMPEDWALHFAVYFATVDPVNRPLPPTETPLRLTYNEWRAIDTRPLKSAYGQKYGMTWFLTALIKVPVK